MKYLTLKAWESLNRSEQRLIAVLKAHFDMPNVVWVTGDWKTGKTDFSLWLCEFLEKISVYFKDRITLDNIATNIETGGVLTYITNLMHLKTWLHDTPATKLFLFDEVNKHLPSRRSMSKKSVGVLQIFPEVSKAHARMVVIGQNKKNVDKTLSDDTWVKGTFYKVNLRTAIIVSPLLKRPFRIANVPPTKITFDPYLTAPFTVKPDLDEVSERWGKDRRLVYQWAIGEKSWKVKGHPQTWQRFLRAEVLKMFDELGSPFTYSGGGNNTIEKEEKSDKLTPLPS